MSSFIQNRWYAGAWSHELAPGPGGVVKPLGRKILGEDIAFYRTATGKAVALESACPHRFVPLEYGDVMGQNLRCKYHGLEFGPDGKCAVDPGNDKPPAMGVKSYNVEEKDGMIFIWIGDKDPTYPAPDCLKKDADYGGALRNHLRIEANYRYMLENLSDDAHATHLHSVLNTEKHDQRPKAVVTDEGNTAQSVISFYDTSCIPLFRPFINRPGNVDQRIKLTWFDPSYVRIKSGVREIGGDLENTIGVDSTHLLTPETESSSHYFWMFQRNAGLDDHNLTAIIDKTLSNIFKTEDAWMAEAQQRYVGDRKFEDLKPALLPQDKFAAIVRRNVNRLAAEEN